MWVEDDALLEELAAVLAPPQGLFLQPTAAEEELVRAAVAAHFAGRQRGRPRRQARHTLWRAVPLAAAGVLLPASAAAAAGVVPLPRAVRVMAHAVGLPVDSPALHDAHRHVQQLREAVEDRDQHRARVTAGKLRHDLAEVPDDERAEARATVTAALVDAADLLESPSAETGEPQTAEPPAPPAEEAPDPLPRPRPRASTPVPTPPADAPAASDPAPSSSSTTTTEASTTTTQAPVATQTEATADSSTSTTEPSTTTTTTEPSTTTTTALSTTTTTVKDPNPRY